mgnify:CR=1 FL=1
MTIGIKATEANAGELVTKYYTLFYSLLKKWNSVVRTADRE